MATHVTHPAEQIGQIDTSRFECINGELYERPVPTIDHALIQGNLTELLRPIARKLSMKCGPELSLDRTPGSRSDWMTPDFSISLPGGYTANANGHALPPVHLIVEILSPGQSGEQMKEKGWRYIDWGTDFVWILEPYTQSAVVLDRTAAQRIEVNGTLNAGPEISIELSAVLAA